MTYYGGKVIPKVQVDQVLYGTSTATQPYQPEVMDPSTSDGTSIASFYTGVTNSPYFDWLTEYNAGGVSIGRGTYGGLTQIVPNPTNDGSTIHDSQIQAELKAQIVAGKLPMPTANTLFAVYFPANETIIAANGDSSITAFCAYHSTVAASGTLPEFYYSVLPDISNTNGCGPFGSTPAQDEMSVSSHEMIETVTDPEVGLVGNTLAAPLAWYDAQQGPNGDDGEVGDVCNAEQVQVTGGDGKPYTVQAQWSNRQNNCVTSSAPGLGPVALNDNSTWAMSSEGSSYSGPALWSGNAFYGSVTTLSGVITPPDPAGGARHVSLVAVNRDGIWVESPSGGGYSAPTLWYSGAPAIGTRATLLADVNGDGLADLVAVGNNGTQVMLATTANGGGFLAPQTWSSGAFYGSRATLATDLNHDGCADLVAVNDSSIWVMPATSCAPSATQFGAPQLWSTGAFYGSRATLAGDITGTRNGAIVAVNDSSIWVVVSNGSHFSSPTPWLSGAFYGNVATLIGDVNGDGVADLVAENSSSVFVVTSNKSAFSQPQAWSTATFYGNRANLLGN